MRVELEQALEAYQQRSPQGLERALSLLQDTVFSFSMKVCGHRQDAEDTMQETLLKAVPYLKRFDNARALAVWLYKVAKSRCLMSRRRSRFAPQQSLSLEELMPDRQRLERLIGPDGETPERSLLRRENREQLARSVLALPPSYRLVLVLHDMEGLSTDEIAQVLNLREGTVRVRLHRARLFLRNQLVRAGGRAQPPKVVAPQRPPRCKQLFAELSDYLDGALDDSLCDELEKHLEGCRPCEAFLHSLEETVARCRRHCPAPLDSDRAARLRRDLLAQYQQTTAAWTAPSTTGGTTS